MSVRRTAMAWVPAVARAVIGAGIGLAIVVPAA